MRRPSANQDLLKLAKLFGVQIAYYDMMHQRKQASVEALIRVLHMLGAPVNKVDDASSALKEFTDHRWRQPLEPVIVIWGNRPRLITLRTPVSLENTSIQGMIKLETGEELPLSWHLNKLTPIESIRFSGIRYVVKQLPLDQALPHGYHRLSLELKGETYSSLLISAPAAAYNYSNSSIKKFWGIFLPLYSLYSKKSWGIGDLSDLEDLIEWISSIGGNIVATLPLLPIFIDESLSPSPYSPVSRLAWNELYANPRWAAEFVSDDTIQPMVSSQVFEQELKYLQQLPLVDYPRQMALKRSVLGKMAERYFSERSHNHKGLSEFARTNPHVADYARFRSMCESRGSSWKSWPESMRAGNSTDGDHDVTTEHYYLYTQWLLFNQMKSLADKARKSGPGLYLDFPLGVNPDGYDVWRYQDLFLLESTVGAPPDPGFAGGQEWGFPPTHPQRLRQTGYEYFISCLRHHFNYAGILRIDHVMGFHRLFVIPDGMEPRHGVYIHYNADEIYAITCLESQRAKAVVVGEDLGTVPPYVRPAMGQHNIFRNYVIQYELCTDSSKFLPAVPKNSVASFNTHDMPPFAAFWQGIDIEQKLGLGILNETSAESEKINRETIKRSLTDHLKKNNSRKADPDMRTVLQDLLQFLSASPTMAVLINLEDLWLETESQNIPGTDDKHPNWRRKARYSMEEFSQMPEVTDTLAEVNRIRRQGGS